MRTTLLFAICLFATIAQAASYKCRVEFRHEIVKAPTGAKVCGEISFETNGESLKHELFPNCQNLSVEFKPMRTPKGVNYVIGLSRRGSNDIARFISASLPLDFSVELTSKRTEARHELEDALIVDCHSPQPLPPTDEIEASQPISQTASPSRQNEDHGMWSGDFTCKSDDDCVKQKGPEYKCVPHDFTCAPPNVKCTGFSCEKPKAKK